MQSLGVFLMFLGGTSILLSFLKLELRLLTWIDSWGVEAGWGIRAGMIILGALIWLVGQKDKPLDDADVS